MAVSGIEHPSNQHVERDYHHRVNQSGANHQWTRRADHDSDEDSRGASESRFTPSGASQSNESAGTYQVTQVQFFSAAALFLLAQTGASSSSQPPSAATSSATGTSQAGDSGAAAPAQTAPTNLPVAPAAVPQAGSQPVTPATGTTTSATTPGASTSSTPDPLQAFNSALQSLGLNQQQIAAFDQVASFINSLSPAIFADLVSQLQTLAQQGLQGSQSATGVSGDSAAIPSSSAGSTAADLVPAASTAPPATGSTASTAGQPTGPYQIEELSIRFSGVEVQGNTGNTNGSSNGAGGTFDFSAFNLSIQEVKVTLADGNGQSAQITTTQPSANNTSTAQTSTPAAATAS